MSSPEEPKPATIPDEALEEIANDPAGFEGFTQSVNLPVESSPVFDSLDSQLDQLP